MLKKIISLLLLFFAITHVHAAYLENIPQIVVQPNGDTLHCYASGDEFYNYLHDKNGFTIIQNDEGYYMYATYDGDNIVASQFVAGSINPAEKRLQPNVRISNEQYQARRAAWFDFEDIARAKTPGRNHGTLNNLVVFIRFSDETNITRNFSWFNNMFNNRTPGYNSMINYFETTSYGHLIAPSHFFPEPEENNVLSYQDIYPRSYYKPYHATSNTNGYANDSQRTSREHALLRRAIEYIADMVPEDLDLDYNNDGYVDNVCFVVKGSTTAWATLLWPHRWALYTNPPVSINGKRVWDYNFMLEGASDYFNTAVLSHEMQHTLSFPDLYRYYHNGVPCGNWDIMESTPNPPQQSGAYMKWKYGNWLNEPTEIQPGKYTLNSIGSGTGFVSYKIPSPEPNQFFVLEFRNTDDPFENFGYGYETGLLIYRINTEFHGNAGYNGTTVFDEVYIFRPGVGIPPNTLNGWIELAYFEQDWQTTFDETTDPKPFLTDGTLVTGLSITDIIVTGDKVSFTYNNGTTQFVSVAYHPNHGEGTMLPQMFEAGMEQDLLENSFTFQGRNFLGWAITPDGAIKYTNNQSIVIDEDIVLYAVWSPNSIKTVWRNEGTPFIIQPNPANGYFEVVLPSLGITSQGVTAQIYDVQGLLLKTVQLYNEKTQIDISNLAKGFYIVKINKEAKKLIVK